MYLVFNRCFLVRGVPWRYTFRRNAFRGIIFSTKSTTISFRSNASMGILTDAPVSSGPLSNLLSQDPMTTDASTVPSSHAAATVPSSHAAAILNKPTIYINELLCFVEHHFHSRASDSIKATVCHFYTQIEIQTAKQLLADVFKSPPLTTKRHKKDKDVDDILSFFKEADKREKKDVLFLAKKLSSCAVLLGRRA